MIGLLLVMAIGVTFGTAQARKLPAGTYITTAKIEILSGEPERYLTAIAMLDSLFIHYGPHAEGLYWMIKIMQDYVERNNDLGVKQEYIKKMVAYGDSLRMCCDNKDIKKKYRKKCDKYGSEVDSASVLFWRSFYNEAVNQIDQIEEATESIKDAADSTEIVYWETRRAAVVDSSKGNMTLAMIIDPDNAQAYIGLGSVYEKAGDLKTSLTWLEQGLEKSPERDKVLISQIAYTYIRLNEYCEAIPFLREYVEIITANENAASDPKNVPVMIGTMHNLTICYNNCSEFDSAYSVFGRMLKYDPENVEALSGSGRYHNHYARMANDSANSLMAADDKDGSQEWRDKTNFRFDSARIYLKRSFEAQPDNAAAAEEYGVIAAILGNYEEATIPFNKVSVLKPDDITNWTSLGDCHLNLKQYAEAAVAYEKAVAIDDSKTEIWQRLKDLYIELGNKTRRAEVEAILNKK